ncbi:MAG: trypsin-like peptidase domain-containing protein [Candidatus Harrisonbacteria bacterium]|nr:trypsin-like peptidase domain-containing protein [Candidatus Harrisonbacteria bacterium]
MEKSPIIKTIKKVMPAVVSIVISKSLEAIEKEIPPDLLPFMPFGQPHLNIPESEIDSRGMVKIGGGSGFIVNSNGTILTNKHVVIDPRAEYTVVTNDEKKYKAEVLARDPVDDVAILKIDAGNLPTVELGDSSGVELGQSVVAIGNALGLFKNTVSAGIISGLARSIRAATVPMAPTQELRGLIQTDAAINPGNSGGPLVDLDGKAIGINAAIVFGAQNLGFAIPISYAERDLSDLKKFGRIKRPLLGLRYVTIDEDIKGKMKLPVDYGAMVVGQKPHNEGVVKDSPADKAGLKEKDIVLECDGNKITVNKTIQDVLEEKEAGDALDLKVLRGKKTLNLKVVLSERKL